LAVNCDDDESIVETFLAHRRISLPVAFDREKKLRETFEVNTLPHLVLVDAGGNVSALHDKFTPEFRKELRLKLQELLE
jgi:hypothetical protein